MFDSPEKETQFTDVPNVKTATAPNRLSQRRFRLSLWLVLMCGATFGTPLVLWTLGAPLFTVLSITLPAVAVVLAGMHPFMRLRAGIPILTYHSVSPHPEWLPWARDISVRPETLDRQLLLLKHMGCRIVDTNDIQSQRTIGAPVAKNTVALHFDDGYLDNRVAAWPILRRHNACATLFVSTDFIAPDGQPRFTIEQTDEPQWKGYLSWRELREMDGSPEFDVQPHGTDHSRVETSATVVTRLTQRNWRHLAWVQWAKTPGPKHDWYDKNAPMAVPIGTEIRQSAPALAAPAWNAGHIETPDAYAKRVGQVIAKCRLVFSKEMEKNPHIYCWPQNKTSPTARSIAGLEGFTTTTAGTGRNTDLEDPQILSRLHVGQDVAGFNWPAADDLAFCASVRCFQGDLYWGLPLMALGILRRIVRLIPIHKTGNRLDIKGVPQ